MNKKQFDKLAESLYKRGYKKYNQQWHHEDYIIGKGCHEEDNKWEEDRTAYQILLSIYDYSDKNWPNLPPEMKDRVGIEIHIDVSRTIDERIEMCMAWHDNDCIEGIECKAEEFYRWVCQTWPFPREEKS